MMKNEMWAITLKSKMRFQGSLFFEKLLRNTFKHDLLKIEFRKIRCNNRRILMLVVKLGVVIFSNIQKKRKFGVVLSA
jgi:hypothetical protein